MQDISLLLLAHGATLWKSLVGIAILTGAITPIRAGLRARLARARLRRGTRWTPATSLDAHEGEVVALSGRLLRRSARPALEVAGVEVDLDGDIDLASGSPAFTALRGSMVLARGMLHRGADGPEPAGYRETRGTFRLLPAPGADGLALVAGAILPGGLLRTFKSVIAMLVAALLTLFAVGEVGIRRSDERWLTLAAATPLRRGDALTALREQIDLRRGADASSIARAVVLDRLRGRCDEAIDTLLQHHQFTDALSLAITYDDPGREARAWLAQGDTTRAADAFVRAHGRDPQRTATLAELSTLVATERFAEAAVRLRHFTHATELPSARGKALRCAALWLEQKAGSAQAERMLEEEATPSAPACLLLRADAVRQRAPDRVVFGTSPEQLFWAAGPIDMSGSFAALRDEQKIESGRLMPRLSIPYTHSGVYELAFRLPPALAQSALDAVPRVETHRALLDRALYELHLTLADALFGDESSLANRLDRVTDLVTAARHAFEQSPDGAARARSLRGAHAEEYDFVTLNLLTSLDSYLPTLRRKLALPGGATAFMESAEVDHAERLVATGNERSLQWLARNTGDALLRAAFELALEGNGRLLVRHLEEKGLDGRKAVELLGARPMLHGDLARWVRFGYPPVCTTCGLDALAIQLAARRDAARAAHADDVVASTSAALARLRPSFTNRNVAVVLAVIDDLGPPLDKLARVPYRNVPF